MIFFFILRSFQRRDFACNTVVYVSWIMELFFLFFSFFIGYFRTGSFLGNM